MTPYLLRSLGERCARFLPRSLGWQIVDTLRGELGKAGSEANAALQDVLDVYAGDVENYAIDTVQRIEDDVRRIVDEFPHDAVTWDTMDLQKVFWRNDVPKLDIDLAVVAPDLAPCVEHFLEGMELGLGAREARRA